MTIPSAAALRVCDFAPEREAFLAEALAGLRGPRKSLPCKFLYDEAGSRLFDRICELPEYYPTRTETRLLREHGAAMARHVGPGCQLIEFGSGSGVKTRLLLDALAGAGCAPAAYVPVDIAREHLCAAAAGLARAYPATEVLPVCADYTRPFDLPRPRRPVRRRVAFFPGSTLGNFDPADAEAFLGKIARAVGPGGGLLIGVDLKKDPATLHAAYNDSQGVTAAFNLNVLERMNRELGADFDPAAFRHYAPYHPGLGRVEMHLVSTRRQSATLGGEVIDFEEGQSIHTESSYKFTVEGFHALARSAGFARERTWLDARRLFSVHFLRAGE